MYGHVTTQLNSILTYVQRVGERQSEVIQMKHEHDKI